MKIIFLSLAITALVFGSVSAQKGVDNNTQFGSGQDSIDCITNISLFVPYAKSGNYKDALEFWEKAFNNCPASTRDLYLYGTRIVAWQIQNEKDPAKKKELMIKLRNVYEQRIKYFGHDKRYPEHWIRGRKAMDMMTHSPDLAHDIYDELKKAIEIGKDQCEVPVIQYYIGFSSMILGKDESHKETFIADYLKSSALLDNIVARGGADGDKAKQAKTVIDGVFATSGAADCESIQRIFGPKIEAQKEDITFLKETIALIRRVRCQEIDCYFAAAGYAHLIEPTAESAIGLAKQAFKQGETETCLKFFSEAVQLATESDDKAEIYFNMSLVSFDAKNYPKCKEYALKAIEQKEDYGNAYLIIGRAYAAAVRSVYPDDPILSSCVYYAVVDKLNKAKSLDPSLEEEINPLIRTYSAHFPKKEDIFMKPELEVGKPFRIGGWIQETVTIR